MKLSKRTKELLKNYSQINGNLLITPGSTLKTISLQKNIVAISKIEEEFPLEFGIYDLNEFLGALTLFENPDLEFSDKCVVVSENGYSIKYYGAARSIISTLEGNITFPEVDVEFLLSKELLLMILKTASTLKAPDLAITGVEGGIFVKVLDKKNPTSNYFEHKVGETQATFTFFLKIDNLKIIPEEYIFSASRKKISKFTCTRGELEYIIAVESDSTFG